MSVVIPFSPRPRAALVQPAAPKAQPAAQILFFTGVRYERQPDPAPAPVRAVRRRRPATIRSAGSGQPA